MPESSLDVLLANAAPHLHEGAYAFCVANGPVEGAVATFHEAEGLTVVLPVRRAEELKLEKLYVADWITLTVSSDLNAVGFLAAISAKLAAAQISCNVFSAVHHDHLFVPHGRGAEAVELLRML